VTHAQRRPAARAASATFTGQCPVCGKVRYLSRREAREAAARAHPGQRMRAYRCGGYWHLTSVTGEAAAWWRERPGGGAGAPGAGPVNP
jgi:hypothetical protein